MLGSKSGNGLCWGIEMPQVWRRSFAHLNMKKKCQVTTTMRVVGRTKYRGGHEYMEPETADVSQPAFLVGATNFSNCVHPKLDNTAEKCSVNGPFLSFTIHHKKTRAELFRWRGWSGLEPSSDSASVWKPGTTNRLHIKDLT